MCSEHGKQGGGAGSRSRGSDDGRTTRDRTPVQGRGPSLRDGKLRRARSRGLLHRLQLAVHTDGHQTETNPGESQQKGGCRAGATPVGVTAEGTVTGGFLGACACPSRPNCTPQTCALRAGSAPTPARAGRERRRGHHQPAPEAPCGTLTAARSRPWGMRALVFHSRWLKGALPSEASCPRLPASTWVLRSSPMSHPTHRL